MYNLGYGSEPFICGPHLVCFFYGGLGFGKYTFHDRTTRTFDDPAIFETMGDVRSYYDRLVIAGAGGGPWVLARPRGSRSRR